MAARYPRFGRQSTRPRHGFTHSFPAGANGLPIRREILAAEDELSISNILFLLLEVLDYDGDDAIMSREVLAEQRREEFDAMLLDVRCWDTPRSLAVSSVSQIESNRVGRVLVVTLEVDNPEILELLERYCIRPARRSHLADDLCRWVQRLWNLSSK